MRSQGKWLLLALRAAVLSSLVKQFLTVVVAASIALLLLALPTQVISYDPAAAVVWPLAIVAGVAAILRFLISERVFGHAQLPRFVPKSTSRPSNAPAELADLKAIAYAKSVFQERFSIEAARDLAATLTSPSSRTSRIVDRVALAEDQLHIESVRTVIGQGKSTKAAATVGLMPIYLAAKGVLLRDLSVSVNEKTASTLSYVENLGAVACVVETAFRRVYSSEAPIPIQNRRILKGILKFVCATDAPNQAQRQELEALLTSLPFETATTADSLTLDDFKLLVRNLSESYYVLVRVDAPGDRYKVKVEISHDRRERLSGLRNRTASLLGLSTRRFQIYLPRAAETPSYHLRAALPEEMYVYSVDLRGVATATPGDSALVITPEAARPRNPIATAEASLGRNYLHAYVRDFTDLSLGRKLSDNMIAAEDRRERKRFILQLTLEIRERPPGILGIVLLLSGYLALLAAGVAHFHNIVFPLNVPAPAGAMKPTAAMSWPTILFGIPAIVSGWLISKFGKATLQRISLVTAGMTAWLVANAAAAVGIAAVKSAGGAPLTFTAGPVHVQQATWAFLTLSCILHLLLTVLLITCRTSRFWHRL